MAFVLSAMGDQLHKLLDVTIYYPQGSPSYWDFVCGKVKTIKVHVSVTPISDLLQSDAFAKDYFENSAQRVLFQRWLNSLWTEKDNKIEQLSMER